MKRILNDMAHGRSGDKGDTSNISIFAKKPEYYPVLDKYLTAERVKNHFGDMVKGDVIRYDVPSLSGFNFVLYNALGGGATHSLRLDSLGKSMASALLRMEVEV